MQLEVSARRKWLIVAATWFVPLAGIGIAFFTLPAEVAVAAAVLLAVAGWLLGRVVLRYVGLLVMAGPTEAMERYWVGTAWLGDGYQPSASPCLALLYLNREAAADAYHMLLTWSFGKRVDSEGHIALSVVDEGQSKYSMFLAPGDRLPAVDGVAAGIKEEVGGRAKVSVEVMKFFLRNCVDYSDREDPNRLMQSLPFRQSVELHVGYLKDGDVETYSKKPFRLSNVRFRQRSELTANDFESRLQWQDLRSQTPSHVMDVIAESSLADA